MKRNKSDKKKRKQYRSGRVLASLFQGPGFESDPEWLFEIRHVLWNWLTEIVWVYLPIPEIKMRTYFLKQKQKKLTSLKGQHPYPPFGSSQQVASSGQDDFLSGQSTSFAVKKGNFIWMIKVKRRYFVLEQSKREYPFSCVLLKHSFLEVIIICNNFACDL